MSNMSEYHCVKSVRILSYSGPHFVAFGLNRERYSARMRENADQNNSEYGHFLGSVPNQRNPAQDNMKTLPQEERLEKRTFFCVWRMSELVPSLKKS